LNDLIGSHESVDRYIHAIELEPLPYDSIKEIGIRIFENFDLQLTNGQEWRITQIACGYPHFAHLICREILSLAYEQRFAGTMVSAGLYKKGIQRAAERAATGLQTAFEKATLKGSNKYVEVLWAVADGQHMEKQFKIIYDDYESIMQSFKDRNRITESREFRNYLNSLCKESHGYALRRRNPGWYRFDDPMLRSYVRMIAHRDGANLGDESFRD